MSKSRQIQQEIEKKLTLVDEGCSSFHQILKKIQSAATQTQKERFEAELKKEIKKLQRHRENLRNLESQDSRFKSKINEARKKIEELMELHKQTERESKKKAFSNEGLMISQKVDPQEEEKEEMRDMVKSVQVMFQDKINVKEAELEKSRNSKGKPAIQEELIKQIKNLNYHFNKLEQVLRNIENDHSTLEQIWSLCDRLENYLKGEDSVENDQEIEQRYKEMNLPIKIIQNFPALNEEEEIQKKLTAKKVENKPPGNFVAKSEVKPVEKGWNTKEALIKITGKQERIIEDLTDEEIEPEKKDLDWSKKQIEQGFCFAVRSEERVKSSLLMPLSPYPCHSSFPTQPMFNHEHFKNFELDTLFFIFYHQQGTYEQFLAAKELKAKGWIYHKKFQSWFQRYGDPKLTAQDREKGTFCYFDYETTWTQRRKVDFEFEYAFLENDLL